MGFWLREIIAREIFIDDANGGGIGVVLRVEETAAQQRDVHHFQIVGPDDHTRSHRPCRCHSRAWAFRQPRRANPIPHS